MRYLVGVGNYFGGDDAVGPRVVEYVEVNGLEEGFEAVDLSTDAMSLIAYLRDDTEAMVVVDAAHIDREPGEFVVFSPDEVESEKVLGGFTTHEGDVLKVIGMARQAGYPIPPLAIMGIQPLDLEGGATLSDCLAERLPMYARVAVERLAAL